MQNSSESLILHFYLLRLWKPLFSSDHRFLMVWRLRWPEHGCYFHLAICVWILKRLNFNVSLSNKTIYPCPSLRLRAETARFSAKISWHFVKFIMAFIKSSPWTTGSKTSAKHQRPSPVFEWVWGSSPCMRSSLATKHFDGVYG